MLDLVFMNPVFWFNLIFTLIIVVVLFIFKKNLHILEALAQVVVTFLVLFIVYIVGFETHFDLHDREVWNGSIKKFVYYEEWTELVHYTESVKVGEDEDGDPIYEDQPRTRTDYHSPEWEIETTIGNFGSSENAFEIASNKYGHKFFELYRSNQNSFGNGNKYESYPNEVIPVSSWNYYDNYIRASRSTILKSKGNDDIIKSMTSSGKLVPYPEFRSGYFGQNYFFRIINTSGFKNINLDSFEKALSIFCAKYSGPKQFNLVVYITSDVPRNFPSVLEEYWKSAHKNDTILIFDVNSNGSINWSDSISFTKNGMYITETKNMNGGFDSVDNMKTLYNKITLNIENNWERLPMETFKYLKSELQLPFWFQILVFLINLSLNISLMWYFLRNNFDKGDTL